jgi:hypothetical protein
MLRGADVCLGSNEPVARLVNKPQAELRVDLGLVGGPAPRSTISRSDRAATTNEISLRVIDGASR